jgi:hypothetical protein
MKVTKTTELDRLEMIYPSSAENPILKRCFLQRFRKGFETLKAHERLSEYPQLAMGAFTTRAKVSPLTLHHEIDVMDVKSAFHSLLSNSSKFQLLQFRTWPLIYQFEAVHPHSGRSVLMKPDGFITISRSR